MSESTPATPAPTASTPAPADAPAAPIATAAKASAPAGAVTDQAKVDDLIAEMQSGKAAVGDAVQAVQAATKAADEIVAEAQSAQGTTPATESISDSLIADLPPIPDVGTPPPPPEVRRLLAIEVPIIVQLGVRRMAVSEVMRFSVGAIIEFQKAADEDLELLANNRPIGKGQAVKVGENFGIKLSTVGPVKEMIRKLGRT